MIVSIPLCTAIILDIRSDAKIDNKASVIYSDKKYLWLGTLLGVIVRQ